MSDSSRPTTPPRQIEQELSSLITPPPTGGFKRRTYSSDAEDGHSITKRLSMTKELDSFLSNDINGVIDKDSDVSSLEEGNADNQDVGDNELPVSQLTKTPASSVEDILLNRKDSPAAPTDTFDLSPLPDGIAFMKLPLKIKKQVYTLLLTVPAVICIRQNRTPLEHYPNAFSNTLDIKLLPGMAFVLTQKTSNGFKSRLQHFAYVNLAVLRASKKVYSEAKSVLYGCNTFDFLNLTKETAPPADFGIRMFSPGCGRMLRSVCLRAYTIHSFRWMITRGHSELKNFYRSLECLTLILEVDSLRKGWGKKLVRRNEEQWAVYTKRIIAFIAIEIFECVGIAKRIPPWIHLKVMFEGDKYSDTFSLNRDIAPEKAEDIEDMDNMDIDGDEVKKQDLKRAVSEAFELFKKGRR